MLLLSAILIKKSKQAHLRIVSSEAKAKITVIVSSVKKSIRLYHYNAGNFHFSHHFMYGKGIGCIAFVFFLEYLIVQLYCRLNK